MKNEAQSVFAQLDPILVAARKIETTMAQERAVIDEVNSALKGGEKITALHMQALSGAASKIADATQGLSRTADSVKVLTDGLAKQLQAKFDETLAQAVIDTLANDERVVGLVNQLVAQKMSEQQAAAQVSEQAKPE